MLIITGAISSYFKVPLLAGGSGDPDLRDQQDVLTLTCLRLMSMLRSSSILAAASS